MRVVYLDADFASATGDTGPRSYAFARRLIGRGHAVTMLTSDRRIEVPAEAGRTFTTSVEGVPVTAIHVGLGKGYTRLGRLWHHLRFAFRAARCLLKCEKPDVVYVTSPPPSAIIPALLAKWLREVPFVLEIREVWPEVPRGIDLIRSRVLTFALRQLALAGYRAAAQVVALTEPALNHIQADIPLTPKVTKIGMCCDIELFGRGEGASLRAERGWTDKFVCLYAGPITHSAGVEAILRVADALREDEQFVFWLVGDGEARAEIERNIQHRDLRNVVVQDGVPRQVLPDIIAAADLGLMTARRFRVLEQAGCERLFDYLAAGKPVLLNYSGWQRELLEEHGAGLGTLLGDYGQFFASICRLCDNPAMRAEMGQHGRHLAETICHPDHWVDKLEQVLLAGAGMPVPAPEPRTQAGGAPHARITDARGGAARR
jgi:glycosyltransferase involved in cell wall biosynthesis